MNRPEFGNPEHISILKHGQREKYLHQLFQMVHKNLSEAKDFAAKYDLDITYASLLSKLWKMYL